MTTVTGSGGDRQLSELLAARTWLRELQAKHPLPGVPAGVRSMLLPALQQLGRYLEFEPTSNPGIVRRGGFKYVRAIEEERVQLATELLGRVDPGPNESPTRIAMLAYQAASIELTMRGGRSEGARWAKFLLGTVYEAEVNAYAAVYGTGGYTVIALNSGVIDFPYQAAKALVAAQHPVNATDPNRLVTARPRPEDVRARLDVDPEPVERLYRTLEAYYFSGYPRFFVGETVEREQILPLRTTVGLAERWIIAHEYGHGLAAGIEWAGAPKPEWQEELFADLNATAWTVLSAYVLDRLPPEAALASAVFALACADVRRRALCVLRCGHAADDEGSDTHPPFEVRANGVLDGFRRLFDVAYDDAAQKCALEPRFERRETPPSIDPPVEAHLRLVRHYADGLFAIWERVRERLAKDHESGRQLHPMWR